MKIQRLTDDGEVIQNNIGATINVMIKHQNKTIEAAVKEILNRKGYIFDTQEEFYTFCENNLKKSYTQIGTRFFFNDELLLSYYFNTSTIREEQNKTSIMYELIFEYEQHNSM